MTFPLIFQDGWRVFFMAAGIYAVTAMGLWLIWLMGGAGLPFAAAPVAWHAHEMIFGFASAALGGFFLTAVPNWTGAKAAPGRFVVLLAGLWLAGRVAVWFSGALPAWLVAAATLGFVPVLAAKILSQLIKRPKPQNLMFLILLTLVWLSDLLVQLDWLSLRATEAQGLRGGLLSICAMIAVLGGRVTPAFTRNALLHADPGAAVPVSRKPAEVAGIALAILTAALTLAAAPAPLTGAAAVGAGIAAALRLAGWRTAATRGQPILWALHVGYGLLALGLIAWGLALWGVGTEIGALHVLGIGAIGGMTLAVMSRASLGHSGRPLIAPRAVALGYGLMPVAAALRWAAAEWPGALSASATLGAGLIWIAAFALYLAALWPVWTRPRVPRAAGATA